MANEEVEQAGADFFADLSVKLRDIEDKQNMIKDRILLIGENLLAEKEENDLEIAELKARITEIEDAIRIMKLSLERLIDDRNSFVRKTEFEILKNQFKMFEPMETARISDIEGIVRRIIKKEK